MKPWFWGVRLSYGLGLWGLGLLGLKALGLYGFRVYRVSGFFLGFRVYRGLGFWVRFGTAEHENLNPKTPNPNIQGFGNWV